MNYEEKYKEALERASKLRVQNPFDTVGQMVEHIFPELQESDNDRIKREILEYINSYANLKDEKIPTEWLEWLEKQGEQKPTDSKKKLDVLKFMRKETCCGLAEANDALLKLIKVLKEHPIPIMDKPRKLKIEWEEQK